jgi:RNA polymerase sigma factor (sigma-70 family)
MTVFVDDRALLLAFRTGEREALARVYWHYVDDVERWIRRFGTRGHDAVAELVQEAFVRAFSTAARMGYDGLRPYRPYLRRLVRNLLVDRLRGANRDITELDDDAPLDDPEPPPDEVIGRKQLVAATQAFIAGLDDESKSFVRLRFEEGGSQEEVARALGTSRRRVRTLETRVRDGLLRHLQAAGLEAELDLGDELTRSSREMRRS